MVLRHYSDPLKPHCYAGVPQIRICSTDPDQDLPQVSVQISGKNIAVTVEVEHAPERDFHAGRSVYVFDWKTGDLLTVCTPKYLRQIYDEIRNHRHLLYLSP